MKVACPHCGETVVIGNLGRPRKNVPVKNILDKLRTYRSVAVVAEALGCSRGYIYGVLKANGLKLKDVVDGNGKRPIFTHSCTPENDRKGPDILRNSQMIYDIQGINRDMMK